MNVARKYGPATTGTCTVVLYIQSALAIRPPRDVGAIDSTAAIMRAAGRPDAGSTVERIVRSRSAPASSCDFSRGRCGPAEAYSCPVYKLEGFVQQATRVGLWVPR